MVVVFADIGYIFDFESAEIQADSRFDLKSIVEFAAQFVMAPELVGSALKNY